MPKFFYTKDYPHRWTSGPFFTTLGDTYDEIKSLEEAKGLAEKEKSGKIGTEDYCVTRYGVVFESDEDYKDWTERQR